MTELYFENINFNGCSFIIFNAQFKSKLSAILGMMVEMMKLR